MIKNFINKKSFWIIFFSYNLLILNSIYISKIYYFYSILIFILNICPLYYYYCNYKKIEIIPLYYFTHIYFFACYTISIFFPEIIISIYKSLYFKNVFPLSVHHREIFIFTMLVYIIGLAFFNLGNYLTSYYFKRESKSHNFFSFKENYNEILFLGILSYILTLIFILNDNSEILKKLNQIKYPLTFLSLICIQLYITFKKNLNFLIKAALYFLILMILFVELLDGSIAKSFLNLIAIYLVNFIVTKKVNIKFLVSIIFVCIVLHTFKYEYRNMTWGESNLNATLENYESAIIESKKKQNKIIKSKILINTYSESILRLKDWSFSQTQKMLIKRNFGRLTHSFQSLTVVSALSPEIVSYWKGYSYKIFITKFIPRIFWEDKPSDTLGNAFGIRYKVLIKEDQSTSWNMPVLNEFYVNFGIVGTIIGMFLFGVTFNLVPSLLNFKYHNYLFIITFITLYPLFYLESHFSLIFGAVLQTFIFLLVYIFLFKKFLLIVKRSF